MTKRAPPPTVSATATTDSEIATFHPAALPGAPISAVNPPRLCICNAAGKTQNQPHSPCLNAVFRKPKTAFNVRKRPLLAISALQQVLPKDYSPCQHNRLNNTRPSFIPSAQFARPQASPTPLLDPPCVCSQSDFRNPQNHFFQPVPHYPPTVPIKTKDKNYKNTRHTLAFFCGGEYN